eukprot:43895-Chlamydomonas_euryale.AAC.2
MVGLLYDGPAPLSSAAAATGQPAGRRVGLLNDRYHICEELGRGAFGQVGGLYRLLRKPPCYRMGKPKGDVLHATT